jgi:hypothetical protein
MMAGVPVSLFGFMPYHNPYGHRLGPGRVVRSWLPCICEGTLRGRGDKGHLWILCRTYEDAGQKTWYYEPPHIDGAARREGGLILEAGAGLGVSYPVT